MKELISKLPDVPVFVRTTILPGTSDMLSRETGHSVYYMPEFLTERTHIEDFKKQTMVFTGAQELLTKIFVGKKFTVMSPLEAELTKYMHNVFGAYKVTYFNACREYCEQMGADWRKVHTGVLLSGYINDTHTYVPGPDGKFGYGGKCFPKDVNAFAKMTEGTPLGTLLQHLHELNVHFRGFEEHIQACVTFIAVRYEDDIFEIQEIRKIVPWETLSQVIGLYTIQNSIWQADRLG